MIVTKVHYTKKHIQPTKPKQTTDTAIQQFPQFTTRGRKMKSVYSTAHDKMTSANSRRCNTWS